MEELGKSQFMNFIDNYYSRCRDFLPDIQVVGAKWPVRTMIPGLSDFDGRIIADDNTGLKDWQSLDTAIGNIHYEMVVQNPEWGRFLEHPVGVCVTWEEVFADDIYHPETIHWSCIIGDEPKFKKLQEHLRSKLWEDRQEYYYLQRFLYYYSPYLHDIDPPVNLGPFTKHYALHSRALHYFIPAMQAALCLIKKKAVRCKFETIYGWKDLLPGEDIFDKILDMIEVKYDVPELNDKTKILKFEDKLFNYLKIALEMIREVVTLIDMKDGSDAGECKKKLSKYKVNSLMHVFNGVRFSRIRKGRYEFYLREPKPFESDWLIANEVTWLRNYFTKTVYRAYGQIKCGQDDAPLDAIIEAMKPDLLNGDGEEIVRTVHELSLDKFAKGNERKLLQRIIPIYGDYYLILEALLADARKISGGSASSGKLTGIQKGI